ncbi:MAG: FAD-dependent oxidoreductase [Coriobacteriales bacterium]|jgi:thioredoxin reductase (NADPH)|nr:FAD-dependent oxidoreductase [Coriobacteriales bacterium]
MYDLAVVGAGPAGLSAAITARARDLNVVCITNQPQESPLAKSTLVDNYPGMPGVSGLGLINEMVAHASKLGTDFVYARVISVLPVAASTQGEADVTPDSVPVVAANAATFSLVTSSDSIEARSVILAVGTRAGGKPLAGEEQFLGRGVSYCATCDGMLFRNAVVCVVGLSSEAPEEAAFLAGLGAKVHYVAPSLPAVLPPALTQEPANNGSISVYVGRVREITGDALGVSGVRLKARAVIDGAESPSDEAIACQGVFVLRPSIAPTTLLPSLELLEGAIQTDMEMRTNVPGVFAAGDCVGKPLQIAKAVGEGQRACFSAVEYLGQSR